MSTQLQLLAQGSGGISFGWLILIVLPALLVFFMAIYLMQRYRRCPSNRILVVYGKGTGSKAAKCIHGGGILVWPLIQDYDYLSLEPMTIDIELTSALSKKNIRVNVPSTFTIGISTEPEIMNNAAERLLGLTDNEIASQARDIILGQMRLVIATLSIEEINQDREKFLELVNQNVNFELNKIGLEMINVNIRDITDESGYIEALGRKAASEAINQAKVEVAQADRQGAIGEATAMREREVSVARETAQSDIGRKEAERNQRISVAKLEAEGMTGEASAHREQEIAIAAQRALSVQGSKQAEAEQRIKVAELEASAVEGENRSKASIADYNASLEVKVAEARRKGEVAMAEAARDILRAEKEREVAKLEKEQLAQQEVERRKIEVDAEAEAERQRRIAKGQADAILAKFRAEAEGVQAVLEAKATGYQRLLDICGERKELATSLLMIEKLPDLVAEQVKAIQNLKIDKITVWDSGSAGHGEHGDGVTKGTTSNFLRSLIASLPPMHELAQQAGVELPGILGQVGRGDLRTGDGSATNPAAKAAKPPEPKPTPVRD